MHEVVGHGTRMVRGEPREARAGCSLAGVLTSDTSRGALTEQLRHRGRRAALGYDPSRGQQERGPAASWPPAPDRRGGRARQRPAHPGRRDDARAARRPRRRGRVDRRRTTSRHARRRVERTRARRASSAAAHPRLDPAGRPAAGALRRGRRAAAGRRRHRPPPRRHAPAGLPRPRRRSSAGRPRLRDARARRPARRATSSSTRRRVTGTENAIMAAVLAPGTTTITQRRLRAARAGPVPPARRAWARDRGHRHELAAHRGRRRALRGCELPRSAPTTSRSARSSAWRR